jgi:hypothetical protein
LENIIIGVALQVSINGRKKPTLASIDHRRRQLARSSSVAMRSQRYQRDHQHQDGVAGQHQRSRGASIIIENINTGAVCQVAINDHAQAA